MKMNLIRYINDTCYDGEEALVSLDTEEIIVMGDCYNINAFLKGLEYADVNFNLTTKHITIEENRELFEKLDFYDRKD